MRSNWWMVALAACLLTACPDDPPAEGDADVSTPDTDVEGDAGDVADAGDAADTETDTDPNEADRAKILAIPSGQTWTIPGLTAPVQVVRVEASIPHIFAENREDMGRALGFIVARDRWLIMDLQRRLGLGNLAELLGDLALENDMESRLSGFRATAQDVLDKLQPEDAAYLDAFCEGVNAYITEAKAENLPVPSELELFAPILGYDSPGDMMVPFERKDVAAMVAVVMYETNFETGDPGRYQRSLQMPTLFDGSPNEALRKAGAQTDIWENMTPPFPYASAAGFGVETGSGPGGAAAAAMAPKGGQKGAAATGAASRTVESGLLSRTVARLQGLEQRFLRDKEKGWGSNAWAVAGSATSDGTALACGDGHLPLYMPSIMWQVGMNTKTFGGGDIQQTGLLITSLPILAVGTNGHIAWSQVNPVTDQTDWYREELQLDADGAPSAALLNGEWKELVAIDETFEVADVEILGSVGRTETITRYTTADGKWIYDIEGRTLADGEEPATGETAVRFAGTRLVPEDQDGDGKITALSFDWSGFEGGGYVRALRGFGNAKSVEEMRDMHRGQIGGGLFTAAADDSGDILYSSYLATPCRGYLQREADGHFSAMSDPSMLLDGTVYGGFTIPVDAEGLALAETDGSDPYSCVIPIAEIPQAVSPSAGFVATANNQPAPITNDGSYIDDPWYLGGPWSSVRVDSIAGRLEDAIAAGTADAEEMTSVQAENRSRLGELFTDHFLDAIANARFLSETDGPLEPWQGRLVDLYVAKQAAMDEVATRLAAWRDGGFATPSGVETFYHTPAASEADDAVATMIFNAWLPRAMQLVIDDEPGIGTAFRFGGSRSKMRLLKRMLVARGAGNGDGMASFDTATGESVFFDVHDTAEIERSDEMLIAALSGALDFLSGPSSSNGSAGGFDTTDMSKWIWGLRHQAKFESLLKDFLGDDPQFGAIADQFSLTTKQLPLAQSIPDGDPRKGLKWFPRPGDNYGVDAGNPGFSGTNFTYGSGPVMRMVVALKDGQVSGYNIVPGGQSMITESDFYKDQVKLWLGNETYPLRFHVDQIVEGAVTREELVPPSN